nr:serine/arginine repetitive matrix protein 2-like [Ipomoea batatas]
MPGSDNQNVSGRDYDEDVAEDENQLRTPTLTEDASTSSKEKSAQVPAKMFTIRDNNDQGYEVGFKIRPDQTDHSRFYLPGKKAAATKGSSDPFGLNVPTVVPLEITTGSTTASKLQVAYAQSRWGKEKATDSEVEEVIPLKRTKRQVDSRPSELQEALRERDPEAATLLDRIRWKRLWSGQASKSALDNIREKEVEPLKKLVTSSSARIKELEQELATAEREAALAKNAVEEATSKMKDVDSLARFLCQDQSTVEVSLKVFIHTDLGDKLVWTYGLEENDFPDVQALLPDEVADPGPKPYSDSAGRQTIDP